MSGHVFLAGGAEFGGKMAIPDRRAIELAGGKRSKIVVIPAAAVPDFDVVRAGRNARRWFTWRLGGRNVEVLELVDRASAESPKIAHKIAGANLIYILGGSTTYLGQTLVDSASERAMRTAYAKGAVIAGSSAGAMVLCEHYYSPSKETVQRGMNFVSNSLVLPHHDTFGHTWADKLGAMLPDVTLIGIDERTGIIENENRWDVLGQGAVTLYRHTAASAPVSNGQIVISAD